MEIMKYVRHVADWFKAKEELVECSTGLRRILVVEDQPHLLQILL